MSSPWGQVGQESFNSNDSSYLGEWLSVPMTFVVIDDDTALVSGNWYGKWDTVNFLLRTQIVKLKKDWKISPKIRPFDILILLNCRHLKEVDARRGFLWTPSICQKIDPPEKNAIVINFLSSQEVSSTREDWLITVKETRSWHHSQTNFVTKYHISHLFF